MVIKIRKYEGCYESNIDYYDTYEAALNHQRLKSIDQTLKGHIFIRFRGLERVTTLISTQGTVQVFYCTLAELNACLGFLGEILIPMPGERLYLKPRGKYDLVNKIRHLVQEGKIAHDMIVDLGTLSELTGWKEGNIRNALPNVLQENFPFGIELKVSRITAGCSRAEPYVESWLRSVEQALREEGFYSPLSFEWEQNQSFELIKHTHTGFGNRLKVVRVKAFLDGSVVTEAQPKHFTDSAENMLDVILDKHSIPYETKTKDTKSKSNPFISLVFLGLVFSILTSKR